MMTMEKFYRLLVFGAAAANYSVVFGSYSTVNTTSSTILNEGFNLRTKSSNIEKLNNKHIQNPYYDDKTTYYDNKTFNEAKDMLRSYFVDKGMEKEKEIMQSPDNYTESITRHRNEGCLNYFMKGTANGEYYGMRFFKDGTIHVGKFKNVGKFKKISPMFAIIDFVDGFCSPNVGLERSDGNQDRVWNRSDGKERKNKIWGIAKRAKDKVQKGYNGLKNFKKGVTTAFKVINNINKNMNPELTKKVQNLVEDPEKLTKTVEQTVKIAEEIKENKVLTDAVTFLGTDQGKELINSATDIVEAFVGSNLNTKKIIQTMKETNEDLRKKENQEIIAQLKKMATKNTLVQNIKNINNINKTYETMNKKCKCCKRCCKCN